MKKRILTLSLLLVSALTASENVRTEIDITAGYNKFDSASKLDSSTFYGVRATMYESEINRYGLQVGYEGSFGVDYDEVNKETDIHRIYTHLVVDGEEEYHVTSYLLLGGGYEYLSDEIKGEPSQGFVDLGLGFKYHLTPSINILLETRAIGKFDTRDLDFDVNLGLGYLLGQNYEEVVTPLDALDKKEAAIEKIVPKHTARLDTGMTALKILKKKPRTIKFEKIVVDSHGVARYDHDLSAYAPKKVATRVVPQGMEEAIVSDDFYVQVAAYNVTDPQPLMDKLGTKGYINTLLHQRDTTTLVLVGPYLSAKEANRVKRSLRRSIKRDAFVTKVN